MEENLFSYPAVLNLNGKRCAVIGGGKVALRKVRTLLASGAQVTVTALHIFIALQPIFNWKYFLFYGIIVVVSLCNFLNKSHSKAGL